VIVFCRSPGRVGSLPRVDDPSNVGRSSVAVSAREISGHQVGAAEHKPVRIRADTVEVDRAPARARSIR